RLRQFYLTARQTRRVLVDVGGIDRELRLLALVGPVVAPHLSVRPAGRRGSGGAGPGRDRALLVAAAFGTDRRQLLAQSLGVTGRRGDERQARVRDTHRGTAYPFQRRFH